MVNLFTTNIHDYCIVDTETTGLDPESCELLEIAIIKVVGGNVIDKFHSYMKPIKSIPPDITAINGIIDADVIDAPGPVDTLKLARKFLGDMLVVGQNVKFDLGFMNYHGGNIFKNVPSIDNKVVAVELVKGLSSYSQSSLEDHFGVFNEKKHSAMGDANALLCIFSKIMYNNRDVDFSKFIRR